MDNEIKIYQQQLKDGKVKNKKIDKAQKDTSQPDFSENSYTETQTLAVLEQGCPKASGDMTFERIQLIHECLIELGTVLKARFDNLRDMGKITPTMEHAKKPEEERFKERNLFYADRYNELIQSDNQMALNYLYAEWCNHIRDSYKDTLSFLKNVALREAPSTSSPSSPSKQPPLLKVPTMSDDRPADKGGNKQDEQKVDKTKDTKEQDKKANEKANEKKGNNQQNGDGLYYDPDKEFKGYKN